MNSVEVALGVVILTQTGIGLLGNSSLLCLFICSLWGRHKSRALEQIASHLALANLLSLLCGGIPQATANLGVWYFLDDAGCKLVFYFHRVAWGSSLSITCLLGGFQALSLNPTYRSWLGHRLTSPKHTNFPCMLSWTLHLLANVIVPMKVTGQKSRNSTVKSNLRYCSRVRIDTVIESVGSMVYSAMDVICLGLIMWTSGFMILFLHRHKMRVQYLHSARQAHPRAPETRATHSILTLMSTFVFCYSLSSVLESCAFHLENPQSWLVNASTFLTSCFPTISPFLLLKSNPRVSSCFFPLSRL